MARLLNDQDNEMTFPGKTSLLLSQDTVTFPMMRVQLAAERSFSIAVVQQALLQDRLVFLTAQRVVTEQKSPGVWYEPRDFYWHTSCGLSGDR